MSDIIHWRRANWLETRIVEAVIGSQHPPSFSGWPISTRDPGVAYFKNAMDEAAATHLAFDCPRIDGEKAAPRMWLA
jgi:hypothetical protein